MSKEETERKNFTCNTYVNDTYKNLVDRPADISCLIISNTNVSTIALGTIALCDLSGTEKSILLPSTTITAGDVKMLDFSGFSVGVEDLVQVKGSAPGLNFTASGKIPKV